MWCPPNTLCSSRPAGSEGLSHLHSCQGGLCALCPHSTPVRGREMERWRERGRVTHGEIERGRERERWREIERLTHEESERGRERERDGVMKIERGGGRERERERQGVSW